MIQKQLMLKDYLELDWNSEPTSDGSNSAPRRADGGATTVRFLLEAELRGCGRRRQAPPKTLSVRAMWKISALFNAVGLLPFAGSEGVPSRSFWRKRGKGEKRLNAKDTVPSRSLEEIKADEERVSLDFPSPVVSSCSGCSESDSFASDFLPSSVASSDPSDDVTAGEDNKGSSRCPDERIGAGKETGVSADVHCRKAIEEEKRQLSPISVMDFQSEEEKDEDKDEVESCSSPSFQNNLDKLEMPKERIVFLASISKCICLLRSECKATWLLALCQNLLNLSLGISIDARLSWTRHQQGTKLQLLQKIRRFECLTYLPPFDLDRHFASSDGDDVSESSVGVDDEGDVSLSRDEQDGDEVSRERKAWGLLRQVKTSCNVAVQGSAEKLLVNFFVEGLRCSDYESSLWRLESTEQPLLQTAREWVERARRGEVEVDDDCNGETTLMEMGTRDERWRWSEEEVGAEVEGLLMGWLMEDLLADVVMS